MFILGENTHIERLRKPMQQITDYLLTCMGVKDQVEIVKINHIKQGVPDEHTA